MSSATIVPVLEPLEPMDPPTPPTPDGSDTTPGAIVVHLPADTDRLTVDRSSLEVWLDLADHLYQSIPRTDLAAAVLEAARVFVKVAWFALRQWPVDGWSALEPRTRKQDPLPALVRYVARNVFVGLAERYPSVDLDQLAAAQAFLVAMAGKSDGSTGLDLEKLSRAADTAAGLPAAGATESGAAGTSGPGTGASTPDASGSAGAEGGSAGEQPRQRRRALGLRWRRSGEH